MLQSFNIEAAKAGAKVVTRSGKPARIVCFDRVDEKWKGNLVVLLLNKDKTWEMTLNYNEKGHTLGSHDPHLDLLISTDGN